MRITFKKIQRPYELLAQITEYCGKENYVFRGEACIHEFVSSSLYRRHIDLFQEYEDLLPLDVEKEIVEKAQREQFSQNTNTSEILTDLRHFGGDTTLIDFSYSLPVALFFACYGKPKEDGRIILVPIKNIKHQFNDKEYGEEKELSILMPVRTLASKARVDSQSSIFIHAPKGCIDKASTKFICVIIPKEKKRDCLEYLSQIHNIRARTIYNDLIGYIQSERGWKSAQVEFYTGLAKSNSQKYDEAIEYFNRSIAQNPDDVNVWFCLANAKNELGQFQEALEDYNKSLEIAPNFAKSYNNRGIVNLKLNLFCDAIHDFSSALKLIPDNVQYLNNRGVAKSFLGMHNDAILDYSKAIEFQPDYEISFQKRGKAYNKIGLHRDAIKDCKKAIELMPEFADAWHELGVAMKNLGKINDAIKHLEKARDLAQEQGKSESERQSRDMLAEVIGDKGRFFT